MAEKRPSEAAESANATPAKRPKTDAAGVGESSPALNRDTDSPSLRGNNKGRGGGGGRGRGRGKDVDSRTWGGRSNNAKGGKMREWGKKEGETEKEGEGTEGAEEKKDRLPKKKVAIMFGYNGIGYSGSQMNPMANTIEGEVWKAFIAAGAISEDNAQDPSKVGLLRAARTDAGVSAAVNVISLKLILSPPLKPVEATIEDYINTFLPSGIRIWSCPRVQGSFNPRTLCDQRQYEYTVPTHVFLGPKPGSAMHTRLAKSRASAKSTAVPSLLTPTPQPGTPLVENTPPVATPTEVAAAAAIADSDAFWARQPEGSTFAQDLVTKREWRISPGLLESAREFVKAYEGSHNYHNFTVGKDFRDRSCQRIMRKLEISDPFIVNGVEYVSISVLGQSFMLHQIRKMVGLLMLAVRSSTPPSLVPETFGPSRIHVPKAPGLGLQLLEPQYVEYNKRVEESNKRLLELKEAGRITEEDLGLQTRDALNTDSIKDKVNAFKREQVYTKMWEVEQAEAVYSNWLNALDVHTGTDFEFLNPKGVIPASAVFKKDDRADKAKSAPLPESDDEGLGGEEG